MHIEPGKLPLEQTLCEHETQVTRRLNHDSLFIDAGNLRMSKGQPGVALGDMDTAMHATGMSGSGYGWHISLQGNAL
jgi:hypothetical protein